MATKLTPLQDRIIKLLAGGRKMPQTLYDSHLFTIEVRGKETLLPVRLIAVLLSAGYVERKLDLTAHYAAYELKLTEAGLTYAREQGMVTDGE